MGHSLQPTYLSGKQCNSRGQIWTRNIHLQKQRRVQNTVMQNTFLQSCVYGWGKDLTIQRVRLHEDPHTIDGHHHIYSHKTILIKKVNDDRLCLRISEASCVNDYTYTWHIGRPLTSQAS